LVQSVFVPAFLDRQLAAEVDQGVDGVLPKKIFSGRSHIQKFSQHKFAKENHYA